MNLPARKEGIPMNAFDEIRNALLLVFFERKYAFVALLATLLMAFIYIFIPVFVTPGNTLEFFLSVTPWWGLLIIFALAALMGLLIAMQYYVIRNTRRSKKREIGSGLGAAATSIVSGIFATATCAACVGALFSFVGTSGIFFLLEYRWEITALGFAMVLLSIFLTARRINNHCEVCGIVLKPEAAHAHGQ